MAYTDHPPRDNRTSFNLVWDGVSEWVKMTQPGGSGGGGTSSSFGAAFPATGTAVGASDGVNMLPLLVDGSGFLKVNVAAGSSAGNAAASATGAAVPASASYTGFKDPSGNLVGMAASNLDYDTGAGTVSQTVLGLALPASGGPVAAVGNSGNKSDGTLRVVIATDQPALTNKLLVTPDSVALPANQSVNVSQVAGTTADTNSGTKSAGTLRVVIATDQPALTNKLLVTPDLPSGASTAAKQPALGTAGTASADVITIQGIAAMTKLLVTPDSVALPANQSVNVAQINGVTPLMGAGNTGTGSARVTIASDQVVIPVGGNVAAAASDAGNPVKIGGKAATAAPTAVTAAQRVDGLFDIWGRLHVRDGSQAPVASTFTQIHVPATNVQATKSQASAGSGKRNVCTGFTFTLTAGASAIAAAAPLIVSVIDGAAGGTTYLYRSYINIPATAAGMVAIVRSGLWLVGTQATALTVEFSAAGGTNSYESVAMDGVIIEE